LNEPNFERRKIYEKIQPVLCDVSLRDGLQNIKNEDISKFSTNNKLNIYYKILFNHHPSKIEIGSLVNPRFYGIFADTFDLFKIVCDDYYKRNIKVKSDLYILTPNEKKVYSAKLRNVTNYSFITATSNSFQRKNINKDLEKTKTEILNMCFTLKNIVNKNIKLYISCINKCPIEGLIDNDFIVKEILYYNNIEDIDEICLSDTCGNLNFEDYKYIVEQSSINGLNINKLSLHLHCSNENLHNIRKIFNYSLDNNINKFDVSLLSSGGCSMTIDTKYLHHNMSYELFYKLLVDYIDDN